MKKQKKLEQELRSLRAYVDAKVAEVRAELVRAIGKTPAKTLIKVVPATHPRNDVTQRALAAALKSHKRGKELVKAGKSRDQLLRSLIPLYLARETDGIEVNSGAISAFWRTQGVAYAGPNAAKALRSHVGYVEKAGKGWAITPNGQKYVDAALGKRLAA